MPAVKTFLVKGKVKDGILVLDHSTKTLKIGDNAFLEEIQEKDIAKKAQEVSEFNNIEKTTYESFGDTEGEIEIEFRAIV